MPDSPGHPGMGRGLGSQATLASSIRSFCPSFLAGPFPLPDIPPPAPPFEGALLWVLQVSRRPLQEASSGGGLLWTVLPTAGRALAHPHHQPLPLLR